MPEERRCYEYDDYEPTDWTWPEVIAYTLLAIVVVVGLGAFFAAWDLWDLVKGHE